MILGGMTITLAVLCVLLGIVVGAIAALALEAAAHRWRVMGMRELAAYRATAEVTVGNGPASRRSRTEGAINGHHPDAPPPSIPPPGAPPGT